MVLNVNELPGPPGNKDCEAGVRDSRQILLARGAREIQGMEHLEAKSMERHVIQMPARKLALLDQCPTRRETSVKTSQGIYDDIIFILTVYIYYILHYNYIIKYYTIYYIIHIIMCCNYNDIIMKLIQCHDFIMTLVSLVRGKKCVCCVKQMWTELKGKIDKSRSQ